MIVKISGKLISKSDSTLTLEIDGFCYEVLVPASVLARIDERKDEKGFVELITYHYIQNNPSRGFPVLVGFLSEIERDFFLQFIQVSGIGPRAAIKALNKPISEISRAIDGGDFNFLKTLPGIGAQKAKEIIAKLQGKVGKYGLIQDRALGPILADQEKESWQEEALLVLLQLQYKRQEAVEMIDKALKRHKDISTAEGLLNEIYRQKSN